MGLKQRTIDIIDHIFIAIFAISQIGLVIFILNIVFEFAPLSGQLLDPLFLIISLTILNFGILFFTKIFLLLERKTA